MKRPLLLLATACTACLDGTNEDQALIDDVAADVAEAGCGLGAFIVDLDLSNTLGFEGPHEVFELEPETETRHLHVMKPLGDTWVFLDVTRWEVLTSRPLAAECPGSLRVLAANGDWVPTAANLEVHADTGRVIDFTVSGIPELPDLRVAALLP